MVQMILSFFGYVKIPKEAIQLSMLVEEGYRRLAAKIPENKEVQALHESAKAITGFLRSGRLISCNKEGTDG